MTSSPPPAIELIGIDKSFGAVAANRGATLSVPAGEIHALVGENGAGKSTLMRVLSGMYAPDAGTMRVQGRDVTGWSTSEAIAAGVGMVHQHFMLVPTLTVAENVVLGREPRRGLGFDRAAAEQAVRELGERTGLRVAPERLVSELSVGEAQRVEILKTLYRGARILILDEPTAVLSPPEVEELWRVLRRLRDEGGTVVLITHKLDEVVAISDAITVMRAGTTVDRLRTAETTPAAIARAMVGREVRLASTELELGIGDLAAGATPAAMADSGPTVAGSRAEAAGERERPPVGAGTGRQPNERAADAARGAPPEDMIAAPPARRATEGPPVGANRRTASPPDDRTAFTAALAVHDLVVHAPNGRCVVDHVSFTVASGEILGIAGVEGNGQTALVEAIAGLAAISEGRITLLAPDGRQHDVTPLGVRERADLGLSHVPEDRHHRGLVLDFPVADNLILGRQHHFTRGLALDRARIGENARAQVAAFDIRPPTPALPARALSGGNQQKIVVAREMGRDFSVLLAAQPTRGVDVGAIEFIHAQLRAAAAEGKAVLLVSADLAEILALADRVAVMYRGRFATVLPRAEASPHVLGPYMTGAASVPAE
ncbi:MAG TPA: ABC transporter ATP-binding protein [Gemmatimonadaceae bacterium]|nr:ABC transporter ATP-binding protein [Gemmatimonadaceae bacterium]